MSFCLGINLESGLIAISDRRITSGNEYSAAKKLTVIQRHKHSMFLMTSGLRSVRDKALTYYMDEFESKEMSFDKLYKAVNAFAENIRKVAMEDKAYLEESNLKFNVHALVGGQLEHDTTPKLYMIYPEGNWIEIGKTSPYQIIGNTSYGKPLLDRTINYKSDLQFAVKVGFLAYDATRISSNDVGYPLDIAVYLKDSFSMVEYRFNQEDLQDSAQWWQDKLSSFIKDLPDQWTDRIFSKMNVTKFPNVIKQS